MVNITDETTAPESREVANKDFGTRLVHKFPFKVMVWVEITLRSYRHRHFTPKNFFLHQNVLPIVKRDGNRSIAPDFTFQQDDAKPHTSGTTIETIKSMGFPLIRPDIWPSKSPD